MAFELWNQDWKLESYCSKKLQTVKYGGDKEFDKVYYDITFKLLSRQKDSTMQSYLNLYPQSQIKFSYDIENLLKEKTQKIEKVISTKGADKQIAITIIKQDKEYIITILDPKNGEKSIPISPQDLYILKEFLHEQGLNLLLIDIHDLTKKTNNYSGNSVSFNINNVEDNTDKSKLVEELF